MASHCGMLLESLQFWEPCKKHIFCLISSIISTAELFCQFPYSYLNHIPLCKVYLLEKSMWACGWTYVNHSENWVLKTNQFPFRPCSLCAYRKCSVVVQKKEELKVNTNWATHIHAYCLKSSFSFAMPLELCRKCVAYYYLCQQVCGAQQKEVSWDKCQGIVNHPVIYRGIARA